MTIMQFNPALPPDTYVLGSVYMVQTVEEATRSKEHIELFGSPSTGFAKYDSQLVGSYTRIAINIGRMAEIAEQGYYLGLCNEDDAPVIYQCVQYYLECWMKIINRSLNRTKVPYELLHRLDRLAHMVYPVALPKFNNGAPDGDSLSLFIENFTHYAGLSALELPEEKVDAKDLPTRQSLQDELINHQARWLK